MMPLTFADTNHEYVIQRITGQDKVRVHLKKSWLC